MARTITGSKIITFTDSYNTNVIAPELRAEEDFIGLVRIAVSRGAVAISEKVAHSTGVPQKSNANCFILYAGDYIEDLTGEISFYAMTEDTIVRVLEYTVA